MVIRHLAFVILLPVLGVLPIIGQMPIIGFAAQATFDAATGLVVAEIRINNRVTGRFGIDTGADRLYIDKKFAENNNLAKHGVPVQRQVVGLGGASGGYFVSFRSFEVGDQRFHNVNATVVDFDRLSGNQGLENPDGLIGYDLLSRMYVTVDYPTRSFQLEMSRPRFLSGRTFETISFKPIKHLIMVNVTFADGQTRPMILDYCATHTIISPQVAKQINPNAENGEILFLDLTIDGKIQSSSVETVVKDLTPLAKSMPRVRIAGILGRTFLAEHKITIDYRTSQIYLHQNAIADN